MLRQITTAILVNDSHSQTFAAWPLEQIITRGKEIRLGCFTYSELLHQLLLFPVDAQLVSLVYLCSNTVLLAIQLLCKNLMPLLLLLFTTLKLYLSKMAFKTTVLGESLIFNALFISL